MNPVIRRIAVSGAAVVALTAGAAATATAATAEHQATVVAIASNDDQDPNGISNGLTRDSGSGSALENPMNRQQTGVDGEQIQTQASGATVGVGVVAILLLGAVVFFRVKGGHLKAGDAVVVMFLGVALAGTVIGGMADQITDSGIASLGGILSGL
ncbi:hypothetical protein [Streptomyces sp. NPDC003832]